MNKKISQEKKKLMCGNEVFAEAAVQAGCKYYFGYPITPQNEISAYLSKRLPEVGGVFLQAESELASISMVHGAAAVGERVLTSSSSPGMSLMMEGISYLAGSELPAVIVNVMRGGPGLGNIGPAQSDYFQAVKGGGHGDYRCIVLAPHTVQEVAHLTFHAFDLADIYRMPVILLADGVLGQMMEPVSIEKEKKNTLPDKTWSLTGCKNRNPNVVKSLYLGEKVLYNHNCKLQDRYKKIEGSEVMCQTYNVSDAHLILVAYGISARLCKSAMNDLRKKGLKVGLIRPITLWPFPYALCEKYAGKNKVFLTVEMSFGQMIEDVRLGVNGKSEVCFYGRGGGDMLTKQEIVKEITQLYKKKFHS
ncbi:MAG: 3-methyl-2-oxobutanoate dehydrogenase subunit VorB [Candidatus Ancaeobacter aquaticus]|nr:3-methyl-2-oxobutanoate dehydrogenase subunit VorB [Candidatus Ancaeobacter aquaticus]